MSVCGERTKAAMALLYNYMLQQTERTFTIIHGLDGYDEISLTNDTKVITNEGEKIMTPIELGKRIVAAEDIFGGNSTEEAAKIFKRIITLNELSIQKRPFFSFRMFIIDSCL